MIIFTDIISSNILYSFVSSMFYYVPLNSPEKLRLLHKMSSLSSAVSTRVGYNIHQTCSCRLFSHTRKLIDYEESISIIIIICNFQPSQDLRIIKIKQCSRKLLNLRCILNRLSRTTTTRLLPSSLSRPSCTNFVPSGYLFRRKA